MNKLSKVELVMENFECVSLDAKSVLGLSLGGVDKMYCQNGAQLKRVTVDNTDFEDIPTIDSFLVRLTAEAAMQQEKYWAGTPGEEMKISDRLSAGNIAQIILFGENGEEEKYAVKWSNEYNPNFDEAQFSCFGSDGSFFIGAKFEKYVDLTKMEEVKSCC